MDKYTSFELSKKLWDNGCRLLGSANCDNVDIPSHLYSGEYEKYQSYDILWDICVKYAKEFFGDTFVEDITNILLILNFPEFLDKEQYADVEEYIWKNCKFNPKNKEV